MAGYRYPDNFPDIVSGQPDAMAIATGIPTKCRDSGRFFTPWLIETIGKPGEHMTVQARILEYTDAIRLRRGGCGGTGRLFLRGELEHGAVEHFQLEGQDEEPRISRMGTDKSSESENP